MFNISEMLRLSHLLIPLSGTVLHMSQEDKIHASAAQVRPINRDQAVAIENKCILAATKVLR